jgi:outer membrane protein W
LLNNLKGNRMKKIITAVSLVAASLSAQAQAQSQGFYIGGGGNFSTVNDSPEQANANFVSILGGTASTTMDTSVTSLRLVGGYKVNENFAIEVGYLNSSKFNSSSSGKTGSRFGSQAWTATLDTSFSGVDVAAIIRPSIASGYNAFFATIGMHSYKSKTGIAVTVTGQTLSSVTKNSGSGTMFGAGYDLNLDKDLDLRLTYIRTNKIAGESENYSNSVGASIIKHF